MRDAAALLETPRRLQVTSFLEPALTIRDSQARSPSPGRVLEPELEPELHETPEVITLQCLHCCL